MEDLLDQIHQKKEHLDKLRPLSDEQEKNLKNVYDLQLTYNSNAIEGSTLTYSETKLILNEGITIGGKSINEHLETINHKEAIGFIEEIAKINTKEIKLTDIKNIHHLILKGIDNKNEALSSLLLAIYGYFAQTEREIISQRTKQGLAAARASGKIRGRPKGVKNKNRVLDPFKDEIKKYLEIGLMQTNILKIINSQLEKKVSLTSLRYFISTTKDLKPI